MTGEEIQRNLVDFARFLDLLWPRHCVVGMKRPSNAADPKRNVPAPRPRVQACAVGRTMISPTSTSAGCSTANAMARAMA